MQSIILYFFTYVDNNKNLNKNTDMFAKENNIKYL